MNSVVEAKVQYYLRERFHYSPLQANTAVDCIRALARVAGHDLDERFGAAGLAAGPEARIASRLVEYAIGGGGYETPEFAFRAEVGRWLRTHARRA